MHAFHATGIAMHATDDTPTACENCATALQGRYCHLCGQAAANPLRHFGHAVEEFFESVWHLDGRVFRTLRELFMPGRVACHYLAGQRARYIAPLRLFIVTTVLTFFLVGLAAQSGDDADARDAALPAIAGAATQDAVLAALSNELAGIRIARDRAAGVPGMDATLARAEQATREQAARRLGELGATADEIAAVRRNDAQRARTGGEGVALMVGKLGRLADPSRPWDESANPVDIDWMPAFADRWFNHRAANAVRNADAMQRDGDQGARLMLGALPSALFMLVPVFALLLRLLYVRSDWRYLEHLVVGLYSHVFLLIGVLVIALMAALDGAVARVPGLAGAWSVLQALAVCALPVYLLLMQKRVYRERWGLTLLKYALLGSVYCALLVVVAMYALFAGLTSGG